MQVVKTEHQCVLCVKLHYCEAERDIKTTYHLILFIIHF